MLGIASVKDDWARGATGHPAEVPQALRRPPLVPEGAPATRALEAYKRPGCPWSFMELSVRIVARELPAAYTPPTGRVR